MLRRHIWWLAPLAGAAVAGGVVAAISLGGGSSAKTSPKTSHARLKPAAAALAFQNAITAVVHQLSPSVVQIQTSQGLGSGVVFDSDGDIVTNNHVIGSDTGSFTVTAGARSYGASLVGRFAPDDLAVVHVSGAQLTPAAFADSSALEVGDIAIAIGNPLGLRSSVTDGIVSAFRQGVSEGNGVALPLMIQTSAAINPGNSGGALADLQGRVIGIPTLAATDPELGASAAPGIGFAIPSNLVKDIATQIIRFGHVTNSHRAYLGIQIGDTQRPLASMSKASPQAARRQRPGSRPATSSRSVNGQATATVDDFTSVVSELKPGTTVALAIDTQRGKRKTLHPKRASSPAARGERSPGRGDPRPRPARSSPCTPLSSSSSSCPRRSRRTGCAESGLTRYWYQESSQATVTASSPVAAPSGTMLACGSPRLFAMPPTVRAVGAVVEDVGGLEECDLGVGELAQDRLLLARAPSSRCATGRGTRRDRASRRGRRPASASSASPPSSSRLRRRPPGRVDIRRPAGALGRSEARGALTHQQGPFTHRALPGRCDFRDPHWLPSVARLAQIAAIPLMSLHVSFTCSG